MLRRETEQPTLQKQRGQQEQTNNVRTSSIQEPSNAEKIHHTLALIRETEKHRHLMIGEQEKITQNLVHKLEADRKLLAQTAHTTSHTQHGIAIDHLYQTKVSIERQIKLKRQEIVMQNAAAERLKAATQELEELQLKMSKVVVTNPRLTQSEQNRESRDLFQLMIFRKLGIEMIETDAGKYTLAMVWSDTRNDAHLVKLDDGYLSAYERTNRLWELAE